MCEATHVASHAGVAVHEGSSERALLGNRRWREEGEGEREGDRERHECYGVCLLWVRLMMWTAEWEDSEKCLPGPKRR